MSHAADYMREVEEIAAGFDYKAVEDLALRIDALRSRGGRLFLVGLGGGAANCQHAAADLRKLVGVQAYALAENVAEFTARVNDEGRDAVFVDMLEASLASASDALFVMSVGGGTPQVSRSIALAIDKAKALGMQVLGVVGRHEGRAARLGDRVIVVPEVEASRVTPHTEAFQVVVLHCLVSHPDLQRKATTW